MLTLLLLACDPSGQGTSVGNPNKTLLRVAPGGEVTLDLAELPVERLELVGSDPQTVDVEGVDVLEGVELDLPAGDWTSLRLVPAGPFRLQGLADQGGRVDLLLEVPVVGVSVTRGPLLADQPHVFELAFPDWLTGEVVGWDLSADQQIRATDPLHADLVESVVEGSALLPDVDGDGEPER